MSFWERLYDLCLKKSCKPNTVAKALGLSTATATKWKNGTIPNGEALARIADYLDCSVDYLLGRDEKKPTPEDGGGLDQELADLINRIPPERMPEVERYLRFQAGQAEKP